MLILGGQDRIAIAVFLPFSASAQLHAKIHTGFNFDFRCPLIQLAAHTPPRWYPE
jgi:hypothetical protein